LIADKCEGIVEQLWVSCRIPVVEEADSELLPAVLFNHEEHEEHEGKRIYN
jgi:hypothetical protein